MTKLDAVLRTSLPASDSGSTAVWGRKRINPRPQSCLCLTWSGYPSNDDDERRLHQRQATSTWWCGPLPCTGEGRNGLSIPRGSHPPSGVYLLSLSNVSHLYLVLTPYNLVLNPSVDSQHPTYLQPKSDLYRCNL